MSEEKPEVGLVYAAWAQKPPLHYTTDQCLFHTNQFQEEIKHLKNRVSYMNTRLESMNDALEQKDSENRILKFKCDELQSENHELHQGCEASMKTRKELFLQHCEKEQQVSKITYENSTLRTQNKELTEELDLLMDEHIILQRKHDSISSKVSELETENADLKKFNKGIEQRYMEKVEKCNASTDKITSLLKDLKKERSAHRASEQKVVECHAELREKSRLIELALNKASQAKQHDGQCRNAADTMHDYSKEVETLKEELTKEQKRREVAETAAARAIIESQRAKDQEEATKLSCFRASLNASKAVLGDAEALCAKMEIEKSKKHK